MPFDIKESSLGAINYIGGNKIIQCFISNPFYTALLIAIIIILTILFVFRNVDFSNEEESLTKLSIRTGIYIFLFTICIQFLQNQYVINECKTGGNNEYVSDIHKMDINPENSDIEPRDYTTFNKSKNRTNKRNDNNNNSDDNRDDNINDTSDDTGDDTSDNKKTKLDVTFI